MKNARAMAEAGAATILPERDLNSDSLATAILKILGAVLNFLSWFGFHMTISIC
jgi:UDP-N-acetylglucosamine:LPS N-acetylglucosamine transferase